MPAASVSIISSGINELMRPHIRLTQTINVDLKTFTQRFGVGMFCYLAGSLIPAVLAMVAAQIMKLPITENKTLFVTTLLMSFIGGFGWQLYYLAKRAEKDGVSLRKAMACNLDSLNGNWKKAIAFALGGLLLSACIDQIISHLVVMQPQQIAAVMATKLHGFDLVMFALLATLIAPVIEEALFRGYAFNALRSACGKSKFLSGKNSDLWANIISAALFAGMHMELSAFLQLFAFGILLAEVYRRSGTIVCPMLMHAMNNSMALACLFF